MLYIDLFHQKCIPFLYRLNSMNQIPLYNTMCISNLVYNNVHPIRIIQSVSQTHTDLHAASSPFGDVHSGSVDRSQIGAWCRESIVLGFREVVGHHSGARAALVGSRVYVFNCNHGYVSLVRSGYAIQAMGSGDSLNREERRVLFCLGENQSFFIMYMVSGHQYINDSKSCLL